MRGPRRKHPTSAITLLTAVLLVACTADGEQEPVGVEPGSVALHESAHPPHIQCLLDHGYEISSDRDGDYELTIAADVYSDDERERIGRECARLRPQPVEQTDEEVRAIFDRWVEEAECLRELGYTPDPPPPFEVFLADWRGAGPWSPVDGVDTGAWTSEEYEQAKANCVLEAFEMGR